MIRAIPCDGVVGFNLLSTDEKPTQYIKTGSMVFETDTQDKYYFDEVSKTWYKYTGPNLDFYCKLGENVYGFFGLSTDEKPKGFGLGSRFVEVDTSKAYILSDDGWKEAEEPGPTPPGPTPQPTLQDKTVDPAITAKQVTYDSGYDGLGTVNITAVTNTIDANIKAENIKKDVAILGVTGTYEPATPSLQNKTVAPKTTEQVVHADEAYDGLDAVTVSAVTNSIDSNIQAANIKKDVTILGITGSYEPATPVLQDKTVIPTTAEQVIHADEAYDGLDDVTVSAVTSSIDYNIQAANIKKGVTILGVVGTYEGTQPAPIDIDCTFDNTGHPESADVFVYGDDISRASSTTIIIDGVDYSNNNLKINSYPIVNFHTDGPTVVEIYVAPLTATSTNIKVDNRLEGLQTDEQGNPIAGIVTVTTLPAGCHTILRGSKETALCRLKVTHVI